MLDLLSWAYLRSGEYGKAEPVFMKLYQADHRTLGLAQQLIRGLLNKGETARALAAVRVIKEQMFSNREKRAEFLVLIEQI